MAESSSSANERDLPSVLNVLVIDTNLSVLEFITHACTPSSYHVIPSSDSLHAANLLRERKELIHLILIEVHMPLMNGYEFLKFVNEQQIDVPLIMMSTDNSMASAMKAFEAGACDYWSKPLNEYQVVNMWIRVLRNSISKDKKQNDIGSQKDDDRRRVIVDYFDLDLDLDVDVDVDVDDDVDVDVDVDDDVDDDFQWSTELHLLFLTAIRKIGLEIADPKKILEYMNVPGLELEDVASHLQDMRTLYGVVRSSDATD